MTRRFYRQITTTRLKDHNTKLLLHHMEDDCSKQYFKKHTLLKLPDFICHSVMETPSADESSREEDDEPRNADANADLPLFCIYSKLYYTTGCCKKTAQRFFDIFSTSNMNFNIKFCIIFCGQFDSQLPNISEISKKWQSYLFWNMATP